MLKESERTAETASVVQTTGARNPALEQALEALEEFRLVAASLPEFSRGGDPEAAAALCRAAGICVERHRLLPGSHLRGQPNVPSTLKLLLRDYLVTEAQASLN